LLVAGTRSSRTKRVVVPGRASLGCPVVSAVIEVRDHLAIDSVARFAFEGITTDLADQPLQRLFDLEILKTSLRPEIEGPLMPTGTRDDGPSKR